MTWGPELMRTPFDGAEPGACKEPGRRAARVLFYFSPAGQTSPSGANGIVSSPSELTPPQTYRMPETASDLCELQQLSHTGSTPKLPGTLCAPAGRTGGYVRVPHSRPADHTELQMRVYEQMLARDFRTPRQRCLSRVGVRARRPRPAPTAFGRGRRLGRTHVAVG